MSTTFGKSPNMMVDFQSYAGPGDKGLRNNELEGYQPVSRIGEVVMNSFSACHSLQTPKPHTAQLTIPCHPFAVDPYEFTLIQDAITTQALTGDPTKSATDIVEYKPHFHEWATVQPGMICVSRKKRTAVFRQYQVAETAAPVIACAACLPAADEKNYYFAGVARSKSVRDPDDGIGEFCSVPATVSLRSWYVHSSDRYTCCILPQAPRSMNSSRFRWAAWSPSSTHRELRSTR